MKRLLAILLVSLLGLTINPLDWESKFNEQQAQIQDLQIENEELRSEIDNMANYLMTETEKININRTITAYETSVTINIDYTAGGNLVTTLSGIESGKTYSIDIYFRIHNSSVANGGAAFWLTNTTSPYFTISIVTRATYTYVATQSFGQVTSAAKKITDQDFTAIDEMIVNVKGVAVASSTTIAFYVATGDTFEELIIDECIVKATKLD